jgi:hypothetical protein
LVLRSETEKHSDFGSNDAIGWEECAKALCYEFPASNGWLESFRTRHNIAAKNLCGERADMDGSVAEDFKATVPGLIEQSDDNDIFNLDKTGLFWKAIPTRGLVTKGEEAKGGNLAKERITVMLTVSKKGDKEIPFVY